MTDQSETPEDVRRIIQLMQEDPRVRDELRRALLTQELLEMPQRLAEFALVTERRFEEIDRRFDEINLQFALIDRRFEQIDRRFDLLDMEIADLRGSNYERLVRDRAPAVLRPVGGGVRRIRVISTADLADLLDEAVDSDKLTEADRDEVLNVDFVARALLTTTRVPVYLAVEASISLGSEDVERAELRARLVGKAFDAETFAVVVSERIPINVSTEGVQLVHYVVRRQPRAA